MISKFLRDVPHILWVLGLTGLLLYVYLVTRDEAIKSLLTMGVGGVLTLAKAVPGAASQQVDAKVEGDLTVEAPKGNPDGQR